MKEILSASDVAAFLAEHYGPRASDPALLGAGEWSRAYEFRLDDADLVIRFGAYGEDFAKDEVMGHYSLPGLPIPRVLEIGDVTGGFYAVSERKRGAFLEGLTKAEFEASLPSLFTTLDAMRDISVDDTTGYGLWVAGHGAPQATWGEALLDVASERPRIAGWKEALDETPAAAEIFHRGFNRLDEAAESLPERRHVIHGDFLNKNVMVDSGTVTAVLDWGNSLYGDYVYDAALISYWSAWYTEWGSLDFEARLIRHWSDEVTLPNDVRHRLQTYKLHIGLEHIAYSALLRRQEDLEFNCHQVSECLASWTDRKL